MLFARKEKRMTRKKNPLVFFDVCVDGDPSERMVFELFSDVAPRTAENFRALCTGEKGIGAKLGKPLHYKGTFFHRIVKGSFAQGGDFLRQEGAAGESIYGDKFPDESSKLKHDEPGLLSMSIADRAGRGSIFTLTFEANQSLDRKNVVFGKLVQGHEVLLKIQDAGDEQGRPAVTVKITNCGEYNGREKRSSSNKLKLGKDTSADGNSNETQRKGRHKKSSKDKRRIRKKYYTSDPDSSSDSETDTSESDTDSELDSSSMSDTSSSSDVRHRKRKRSSKRDKYKRGKRRDRRREEKRRKRVKRSKRRSKRSSDSLTESETNDSSSEDVEDDDKGHSHNEIDNPLKTVFGNPLPTVEENDYDNSHHKQHEDADADTHGKLCVESPKENGEQLLNGYERVDGAERTEDRQPDTRVGHSGSSRSTNASPKRAMTKSMSISGRSESRSPSVNHSRRLSRSSSASGSPRRVAAKSRSISRSPGRSPAKSMSKSPSPQRRSNSYGPINIPPRNSPSQSPVRTSSRRSSGRSPTKGSRSPARSRRSVSPVRSSYRSPSRSPGRAQSRRESHRIPLWSPRNRKLHSYSRSRSPVRRLRSPPSDYGRSRSPARRHRSPPSDGRSVSRSPADGSPKRIRRGRGFSDKYSYARRYRTPSPDRYRYGRRYYRERYSGQRRYSDRSPRRYRSPSRSPPRNRGRRSRTRSPSISRSPPYHRNRYNRSRSPAEPSRYRPSPRVEKRLSSPSGSHTQSRSRSRSQSASSRSPSGSTRQQANRGQLRSRSKSMSRSRPSSGSTPGKKGLVSYGDGSPEPVER